MQVDEYSAEIGRTDAQFSIVHYYGNLESSLKYIFLKRWNTPIAQNTLSREVFRVVFHIRVHRTRQSVCCY